MKVGEGGCFAIPCQPLLLTTVAVVPGQDLINIETGPSLDTIQRQLPIFETGGWIKRKNGPAGVDNGRRGRTRSTSKG
jgi:hypothetical protein